MPQGIIVAVRPINSKSHHEESAFALKSSNKNKFGNMVFVAITNGPESEHPDTGQDRVKFKSLVWFEDTNQDYEEEELVCFDIDRQNKLKLSEAKGVKKIKSDDKYYPKKKRSKPSGMLPKIALLASALLLFAVVTDSLEIQISTR